MKKTLTLSALCAVVTLATSCGGKSEADQVKDFALDFAAKVSQNQVDSIRALYADAAKIDFDDSFIYRQIEKPIGQRQIPEEPCLRSEAIKTFKKWENKQDKTPY